MLKEVGDEPESTLLTMELATLLERLADQIPVLHVAVKWAGRTQAAGNETVDEARALAARIRKVLGESNEM